MSLLGDFALLLIFTIYKAPISQIPLEKYASSAAERLQSLYPLPVLPNRLQNMRSLMQKIQIFATFFNQILASLTSLHTHKFAGQIHKLVQNSKAQEII